MDGGSGEVETTTQVYSAPPPPVHQHPTLPSHQKARALHADPHPVGSKKLQGEETDEGEPIYRERSGDYRILYLVRVDEVVILDIDHRKDVYG